MTEPQLTDYEIFEQSSPNAKRDLRRAELMVDAQEQIAVIMQARGISRSDLAARLGKTRGYVTQILSSGRNLTLRTWADIATAMGCRVVAKMSWDETPEPN